MTFFSRSLSCSFFRLVFLCFFVSLRFLKCLLVDATIPVFIRSEIMNNALTMLSKTRDKSILDLFLFLCAFARVQSMCVYYDTIVSPFFHSVYVCVCCPPLIRLSVSVCVCVSVCLSVCLCAFILLVKVDILLRRRLLNIEERTRERERKTNTHTLARSHTHSLSIQTTFY
jgi:hypothetical protein